MNNTYHTHEAEYWDRLIERYYNAETTEEEERSLRRFLASKEGSDSRYDETKAVMGFIATGKRRHCATKDTGNGIGRQRYLYAKIAGMAASATMAYFLIGHTLLSSRPTEYPDICIAYTDGKHVTDRNEVLSLMKKSMQSVTVTEENEKHVEELLYNMFNSLSE